MPCNDQNGKQPLAIQHATDSVAAEALGASEHCIRSLYRSIPAMIHSIDASGSIVDVSDQWLKTLGYERDEVIGRKSLEFLSDESRRHAAEVVLPEFFRTGACRDIPYQVMTKDGRILDVLLSATCEHAATGEITRSLAIMQDVTESNRLKREMTAAKNYSESLIRNANVMIVELDLAGNLKQLNPAAEKITGYRLADIKGRNWFEMIAPRTRYPAAWAEFERLLAVKASAEFENPILTHDGHERHISWRNSPLVEDGKVIGTLSLGIDITEQKAIEHRLALNEASLREAQSVAHIGSWVLDHASGEIIWSDEVFAILDIDRERVGVSKDAFLRLIHPDDQADVKRAYKRSIENRRPYDIKHRLLMPDGAIKYVHQRSATSFDEHGTPQRTLGTIQDITSNVLQEMSIAESEERFRTIADYTYDWEYWQGAQHEILYISPSCKRVTGYTQGAFISDPGLLERIVHPDDRYLYEAHLVDIQKHPEGHVTFRIVREDGEVRWIAHGCRAVVTSHGEQRGRRVSNRDITDLKNAEQLAQQLAHYDTLTKLPNRRMLMDRLHRGIAQARRHKRPLAVMFLDLDNFKLINDSLGHDVGDRLLIEIGDRLLRCVRAADTVSRSGGDEFVIVLPEIAAPQNALVVARKINETIREPVRIGPHVLEVTASIGIAVRQADCNDDEAELMKKADVAMYAAKQAGRNSYRLYEGS